MAILGVDDFKAKIRGGGARPNLFKATINFPGYADGDVELSSFLCKSALLPESTIGLITVPFRGRNLKVAGDRTFAPWTVTIINDTTMDTRNALERWMNGINAMSDNSGLENPADYQVDAFVDQLDRAGNVIKSHTFRGMWPTTLDNIDLGYDTNDSVEEFGITFRYQFHESNTTT